MLRCSVGMESAQTQYHIYDSLHLVSPRIWADHFLFSLHCLTNLALLPSYNQTSMSGQSKVLTEKPLLRI